MAKQKQVERMLKLESLSPQANKLIRKKKLSDEDLGNLLQSYYDLTEEQKQRQKEIDKIKEKIIPAVEQRDNIFQTDGIKATTWRDETWKLDISKLLVYITKHYQGARRKAMFLTCLTSSVTGCKKAIGELNMEEFGHKEVARKPKLKVTSSK